MGTAPRTLDWKPNHDERSLNYPVRELLQSTSAKSKQWEPGPILDQGHEGACVGFAWAAEALAKPIPVDIARMRVHTPRDPNLFAKFLYGQAQYIDEWPGEGYEGTSVLAGAKAAQNVGVLRAYRWAFSIQDVIDSVVAIGPVVIGIPWYSGMYEAPEGVLKRSGTIVGGHALLVVGYDAQRGTAILQNSWGSDWGTNGLAHIDINELAALLRENGEACVPVSRSYGR